MPACSRCGQYFTARPTGGRPRSRCDACRTAHEKIDGTTWRNLRRRVLREEPVCAVPDCDQPSTEVDHIVPLVLGGASHDRANLQGMCRNHNASKGGRMAPIQRRSRCTCGDPSCPGRWHL